MSALFVLNPELSLAGRTFDVAVVLSVADFLKAQDKEAFDRVERLFEYSVLPHSAGDVARQTPENEPAKQGELDRYKNQLYGKVEDEYRNEREHQNRNKQKLVERVHKVSALHEPLKLLK